ncbi:hypothetical protein BH23VER1_BH23VER1_13750 [soil metagenome]
MPEPDPSPALTEAAAGLIRYLQSQRAKGVSTVFVTEEAKKNLGDWARATLNRGKAGDAPRTMPSPRPPAAAPAPPRETGPAPVSAPRLQTRSERLDDIRHRAEACEKCRCLGTLRDQFVFATGNPEARLMLVGEAPGREEEMRGEPFVGKAGELLNKILKAMALDRPEVYISNIVKWRPMTAPGERKENRKPDAQELEASRSFIMEEISVVQPEVIVALGGTAASGLLGLDQPVGALRGRFHDLGGTPVMVTYHPSYLLRNAAISEKRKVWEDMLLVMEKLALHVTEKQRAFFTDSR